MQYRLTHDFRRQEIRNNSQLHYGCRSGYKYIEKFHGGVQWYMMESRDIVSSICFKLKNENEFLVSFNGQSLIFRLSIKKV